MRIFLGADHAGFQLKQHVGETLRASGHEVTDVGTDGEASVDYPDYARQVAEAVSRGEYERGIVLGGSGNGEAIVANRHRGIRCGLCWSIESARLARLHNDANMLARAAVEGKLDTRADATRHQGDFRRVVEGVNKTLDSVIGPLNIAAEYVDRISKGNIPNKITDNYNGDFNAIKNNLNQCIEAVNQLVGDADTEQNADDAPDDGHDGELPYDLVVICGLRSRHEPTSR